LEVTSDNLTYAKFEFEFSYNKVNYERRIYSFFDMLGDVGGLNDALVLIFSYVLRIFTPVFFASY